jgi:thiol-disulfide isomerase/thioredoxin
LKKLWIACLILISPFVSSAQTATVSLLSTTDTKRPVLLIFSGSDWCAPCIRFERTILSEPTFQSYADENLTIVKADFPQRKKISDDQKKQNEALADQYNPKGLFPHIVLLNADHSVMATLTYSSQTPDQFISKIRSYVESQQQSPTNE